MSAQPSFSIGALARTGGVSIQTLRHYDRLGLLRPSFRTRAGYRHYDEADRVRLDLIRALRALDFDLGTIGRMLRGAATVREVTELHLKTLDLQMKTLARRRAVLRVLLRDGDTLSIARLQRLQALATIEGNDRVQFVGDALAARLKGTRNRKLGAAITRMAMVELPDSPTDEQVEAWLELAELVSDATFMEGHRNARAGAPRGARPDMNVLCRPAAAAAAKGVSPSGRAGRPIVVRWIDAMLAAQQRGRGGSVCDRARLLRALMDQAGDTRDRKFWQLLAVINPDVARSPITIAWPWLERGLEALSAGARETSGRRRA